MMFPPASVRVLFVAVSLVTAILIATTITSADESETSKPELTEPPFISDFDPDNEEWKAYREHVLKLVAYYEERGFHLVPSTYVHFWPQERIIQGKRSSAVLDEKTGRLLLDEEGKPVIREEDYEITYRMLRRRFESSAMTVMKDPNKPSPEDVMICWGLSVDAFEDLFGPMHKWDKILLKRMEQSEFGTSGPSAVIP